MLQSVLGSGVTWEQDEDRVSLHIDNMVEWSRERQMRILFEDRIASAFGIPPTLLHEWAKAPAHVCTPKRFKRWVHLQMRKKRRRKHRAPKGWRRYS